MAWSVGIRRRRDGERAGARADPAKCCPRRSDPSVHRAGTAALSGSVAGHQPVGLLQGLHDQCGLRALTRNVRIRAHTPRGSTRLDDHGGTKTMITSRTIWLGLLASFAALAAACVPAAAQQQQQKPNILFIMGDDIGWMQPSIYHRGLMVGETPNIDKIGHE